MLSGLKDRMFNMSSSAQKIILTAVAAVVLLSASAYGVCAAAKSITVVDDGNGSVKQVITFKRYVEEVLAEEKIALSSKDKLNVSKDTKLKDDMKIEVYRAFDVIVTEKGQSRWVTATRKTAGGVLEELGYNPKRTDKITPGYDAKVSDFDEITLVRTEEKTVQMTEEIPYEVTERENKNLASGKQKLVQKGVPGEKEVSYKICYEDGKVVSMQKLSEEVKVKPIAQIREVGVKKAANYTIASAGTVQTSRSGNLAYSKVISANATAYDASSCGKSPSHPAYGITATGRRAGYGIVAVDPSVIPLGSKLYIESADGSYVYGHSIAADTGGAIKGNRVDLCFDTRAEAIRFGRRPVKVYVLK